MRILNNYLTPIKFRAIVCLLLLIGEISPISHDVRKRSYLHLLQDGISSILIELELDQTCSQLINQLTTDQLNILSTIKFELLKGLAAVENVLELFPEGHFHGEESMDDDRIDSTIADDLLDNLFITVLAELLNDLSY